MIIDVAVFDKALVRCSSAKKDSHSTLYLKDVTDERLELIASSKREKNVLFPSRGKTLTIAVSQSLTTD